MTAKKEKGKSVEIQEIRFEHVDLIGDYEFGMHIRKIEESNILRSMSEMDLRSLKAGQAKILSCVPSKNR